MSGETGPAIVVIAGPTASGKSGLAMAIAERLGGEIVNADSVAVYRGFDIGSAKPSLTDRARLPHHLVDSRDPTDTWSAADFVRDADEAIAAIAARGRLPIVVGGTGLYLRSLLHGLAAGGAAQPELRAALTAEIEAVGIEALYARLRERDPAAAAAMHHRDTVRIIRALEVIEVTGRKRSEQNAEHGLQEERYRHLSLMVAGPRDELHRRIGLRTRAMVEAGLVQEVRALLASGIPTTAQPFGAIGYRHVLELLDGRLGEADWVETLARDTRHFARRQLTWFRKHRDSRWLPFDGGGAASDIAAAVQEWWQRGGVGPGFATEHDVVGAPSLAGRGRRG